MSTGQAQAAAGHHKETIALIAVTSEEGLIEISYGIADGITRAERREVVGKLEEFFRVFRE